MKNNHIKQISFEFSLKIIELYKVLKSKNEYILSKQLLRSGTSIGANIVESEAAQSTDDFVHKLSIASKEARETRYWLLLLKESKLVDLDFGNLFNDIDEIISILTSIIKTIKLRKKT